MTDDPIALVVLLILLFMCLIEFGCAGPGYVYCPDGTAAFWPDLQTDRAIDPRFCR